MHIQIKNKAKLTLANLLKRRRITLKQYMKDVGITSYPALVRHCENQGVDPPAENDYRKNAELVTDPSEGLIVLEPEFDENSDVDTETKQEVKARKRRKKIDIAD